MPTLPHNNHSKHPSQPLTPSKPEYPPRVVLSGRYCRVEPLDCKKNHFGLKEAHREIIDIDKWSNIGLPAPAKNSTAQELILPAQSSLDPLDYVVVDMDTNLPIGTLALTHIDFSKGVIEIGSNIFPRSALSTRVTTEAYFMVMRFIFDELGFTHCEWECDANDTCSREFAEHLGFRFEGLFPLIKEGNGPSIYAAWLSIVQHEWPLLCQAFKNWLSPKNLDNDGYQINSLSSVRKSLNATHPCVDFAGTLSK